MDAAFTVDEKGKLIFARDGRGNFYKDDRAFYNVIGTLLARKGQWGWDGVFGTRLREITKDARTTGTRLRAQIADCAEQLRSGQTIKELTGTADRSALGRWSVTLRWVPTFADPVQHKVSL